MRKITSIALVLCLLAISLITSCQPMESIAVEDIIGVWIEDDPDGFHLFLNEDGTFIYSPPNSLEDPYGFGKYQLEGTTMNVQNDDESPWCTGYSTTLHTELIDSDKLVFTKLEGDCPDWSEGGITFYRITP